jgi:membrane-associated phospholipid phosphatase
VPKPLIAAGWRLRAAVVVALAALVTLGLGLHYSGTVESGRIDSAVDTRVFRHLGTHRQFLHQLVHVGDPTTIGLLSAALTVGFLLARHWRAAVLAALAPVLAGVMTDVVLKPLIDRRIGGPYLSFPSGHTTGAFAIALVATVVLLEPGQPRLRRTARALLAVVALGVAAAVALALVALRVHYTTDTIGGVGVALGVVLGIALLVDAAADGVWRLRYPGSRPSPDSAGAKRSPVPATRSSTSGAVNFRSSGAVQASTSSQVTGVETVGAGRARKE